MASGTESPKSRRARFSIRAATRPSKWTWRLAGGAMGRAAVPRGASTGVHEALRAARWRRENRYGGKGRVEGGRQRHTKNSHGRCAASNATRQADLDAKLIALDGTENKANLGANAMLGVSLARGACGGGPKNLPLYRYLNPDAHIMPVPGMNILTAASMRTPASTCRSS